MRDFRSSRRYLQLFLSVTLLFAGVGSLNAQSSLPLEQGDHVTIVGNGLAERMTHFGYFETLLHSRFPEKNLVVRNLGYSGDVVEMEKNLRLKKAAGRDEWLSRVNTDVIIAMYGFNESFRGPDRVNSFREHIAEFVEHVTSKKYNGSSAPRLALVSPIAFEDLNDPNLPDGSSRNRNLKQYTQAIQTVAKKNNIPFVNLFAATRKAYSSDDKHWTFNGVHLTEYGYKQLSGILDRKLFGDRPSPGGINMNDLRAAVNEKNEYWFDRYHVNDGINVFGIRAGRSYNGTSNREVYRREMEILEQMVANREKKVWAIARGENHTVTDDNLPDPIEVGGSKAKDFLGPKEAIRKMDLHDNLEANLFASEEQFPELVNPLQVKFDPKGRLWVIAWESYPNYEPPGKKQDELLILEDIDNDGRADQQTVFAEGLKNPTGFQFWNGGVIVAQAPYIMFLKDTNGDGRADMKRRLLAHISTGDTHHTANSFVWGAGGSLFFREGIFHRSQIETPYGVVREKDGVVWRFDPDRFQVQRYIPMTRPWHNTHGHVINGWNQGFSYDAGTSNPYHDTLVSGYLPYPKDHREPPRVYEPRVTPNTDAEILSSRHFPERMRDHLLVANVMNLRGIQQYELTQEGASYQGNEVEPLVRSSDPNFRPTVMTLGPKGALYVCDWHNPVIGHAENHIRSPRRDHEHGRVYRFTYEGRSLSDDPSIDDQPIPELLDLLKHPENYVRLRAKIELDAHDSDEVVQATDRWLKQLDPEAPRYEHHVLEGLWIHQWHNRVNGPLLKRVMEFEDDRARAAAVRLLGEWRGDVEGVWALMEQAINDPAPLVRLEAVRALSYFRSVRATRMVLQVLNHDMDKYLKYTLNETMRGLKPYWKRALSEGKPVVKDNDRGLSYLLDSIDNAEEKRRILLNQTGTPAVNRAILVRPNIPLGRRREALRQLAESQRKEPAGILLDLMMDETVDTKGVLTPLLDELSVDELVQREDQLKKLAQETSSSSVQTTAFIALATMDGHAERIGSIASRSVSSAGNFLKALQRLKNEEIRTSAYSFVKSLAIQPPERTVDSPDSNRVFTVKYYSNPPKNARRSSFEKKTPEVTLRTNEITVDLEPVRSGGDTFALQYRATMNIPRPGTYTFHLTSDDGSRLYVDGKEVVNNDGAHDAEEKSGAVKLTEGQHELTVNQYDQGGQQALSLEWTPPGADGRNPLPSDVFRTSTRKIQEKAIRTLAELPVNVRKRFSDLVEIMEKTDRVVTAASQARRIGQGLENISKEVAAKAVKRIGGFVEQLSPKRRSRTDVTDVIMFAQELTRYAGEQGTNWRRKLTNLTVRTITIRAVPGEMQYDTEAFTVAPGETIAVQLRNPDANKHNLVITVPGAYEFVGSASMNQKNGPEHEYIPQGKRVRQKIKWHTSILEQGGSDRIVVQVPNRTADYPYLCTFPGHWRTMKGVMRVRK